MPRRIEKALGKAISKMEKQETALEEMQTKLTQAQSFQVFMKAVNNALRMKNAARHEKLLLDYYGEKGTEEELERAREGFPRFVLTNNLANIKRMKNRVSVLTYKNDMAQKGENEIMPFPGTGLQIIKNWQEDRLQLIFENKPEEKIRALLKANGFRWSPTNGAWQRRLTGWTVYSIRHDLLTNAAFMQCYNA
jgi:hypothetical protein